MRIRTTVAAVVCALGVAFSFPGSAQAASGEFHYLSDSPSGGVQSSTLEDPESRECITLPEVADEDATDPAFAPWNDTDASATVFTGPNCDGDYFTLRPHGRPASNRLELRSVVFS